MNTRLHLVSALALLVSSVPLRAADQVKTADGIVEGARGSDSKIRSFKGIPFAKPPVGDLRWQPPQPAASWQGVRPAVSFGSRCAQGAIFSDMIFRDPGPSEDCLYLNVWTPADAPGAALPVPAVAPGAALPVPGTALPVMVWIYGGGFQAGAASEPRQDGENLARKGVVVVSMNYRMGVFGFFAHPELTKESPHHASGNYGLMDQTAALRWVQKNIAAFGGDPANVTIFGESAGSMSVSSQMAAPSAKGLFKQAIGESGASFPLNEPMPGLQEKQATGLAFARSLGAETLKELRAKPASEILKAALAEKTRFWPIVDGYFFPRSPAAIYAGGEQSHVPLLAGWNSDENSAAMFFGKQSVTAKNFEAKVRTDFGSEADQLLKLYPSDTDEVLLTSARDLAGDTFIAYSTWKWLEVQNETGGAPVYRYHFEQIHPVPAGEKSRGAYHSSDIDYVFQSLNSEKLPVTESDRKAADVISSYWTNFAKTGDPNGPGLPKWQPYKQSNGYQTMHLQVTETAQPESQPDKLRDRYLQLDQFAQQHAHPASSN